MMEGPIKLFYCYARTDQDKELRDELEKQLLALELQGRYHIDHWDYDDIQPGTNPKQAIYSRLLIAHLILLLISPDFIASEECYGSEMRRALHLRSLDPRCRIIPILLRPIFLEATPFSYPLPIDPKNQKPKPITLWSNRDEAFRCVVAGIRKVAEDLQNSSAVERQTEAAAILLPIGPKPSPMHSNEVPNSLNVQKRSPANSGVGNKGNRDGKDTLPDLVNRIRLAVPDFSRLSIPTVRKKRDKGSIVSLPDLSTFSKINALKVPRRWMLTALAALVGGVVITGGIEFALSQNQVSTPRLGTILCKYSKHTNTVKSVAWSPNGQHIASGSYDRTVQVWKPIDGSQIFVYNKHSDIINSVAWSPNGQHIASGSNDNTVRVWNVIDGTDIHVYINHRNAVESVAWSPNGQRIASGSLDNTVQVWDPPLGSHILVYGEHTESVRSVAWSPNGQRIASGSDDGTVRVWNAVDGTTIFTYTRHLAAVNSIAWSPDGQRIASGSYDNTVHVWNADYGDPFFVYNRHSDVVNSVAWSPNGERIASGSYDKTVHIWNAADGTDVFLYRGDPYSILSIAWSPDGKRIASAGLDNSVQIWEAE